MAPTRSEEGCRRPRTQDRDTPEIMTKALESAKEKKCGCCGAEFDSRNVLFEHLRQENHIIESDDESLESASREPTSHHADEAGKSEIHRAWKAQTMRG